MKTEQQINEARAVLCSRVFEPGLSQTQTALLTGMLNALVWAADGPNASTIQRVLDGELFPKARPQLSDADILENEREFHDQRFN